ncbi:MAG TPA: hypothetical protein VN832_14655 [Stellaceae bacterium]|nr:hypothetical protein [Stellaceae bacterium]
MTIDSEFGSGGTSLDPSRRLALSKASVYCPARGEDHGLPLILKALARHRTPATFFVETLCTTQLGDAPVRQTVDAILAAGHDVQLHIHPYWLGSGAPGALARADRLAIDSCAGWSLGEIQAIIEQGLEPLARWKVQPPIALRTGNLTVDRTVYRAMARLGINVASNIGFACFRASDPSLHLMAGRHWIDGVLEIPVTSYVQFSLPHWKRYRLMTITAVGAGEMISLLRRARAKGVSPIVILTHPFEFIKGDRPGGEGCLPNRINQRRLVSLLEFLADHRDEFAPVSIAEAAPRWLAGQASQPEQIQAPLLPTLRGTLENKANDFLRWL